MTLIVNLFAGPGAGKSTLAAQTFGILKSRGVCAELALEFAKDLTWEKRYGAMECQPYVFGEQLWRIQRLVNAGVEVVITDSPLLLSTVYGETSMAFKKSVREIVASFRNLNIMVRRVHPYNPLGRRESEAIGMSVDHQIEGMLHCYGGTDCLYLNSTNDSSERLASMIHDKLEPTEAAA